MSRLGGQLGLRSTNHHLSQLVPPWGTLKHTYTPQYRLATSFEISHFALIKSDLIKAMSRSLRQTREPTTSTAIYASDIVLLTCLLMKTA